MSGIEPEAQQVANDVVVRQQRQHCDPNDQYGENAGGPDRLGRRLPLPQTVTRGNHFPTGIVMISITPHTM